MGVCQGFDMSEFVGRVAVVTGAGAGIGRALALGLAERGARLALSDIDPQGLATTAELAERHGVDVMQELIDVADAAAVDRHAAAVIERFGTVNQVYNNAGIAFGRSVLESQYADYERILNVNLWGVIHGTKAFLPHLIASGDGHVINLSSLNGLIAQGLLSHYCVSKYAVRGFTESLRIEMLEAGYRVRVTCVHPGGVKTNISSRALERAREAGIPITAADEARTKIYNERLLRLSPDDAAATILKGVNRDRPRVLVGTDAKILDLLSRQLPGSYQRLIAMASARLGIGSDPR